LDVRLQGPSSNSREEATCLRYLQHVEAILANARADVERAEEMVENDADDDFDMNDTVMHIMNIFEE
jgi:hypothetical protein